MVVAHPDLDAERWSADVVLADGSTTRVRPIDPSDGPGILAFHERQSRESIYFRFFSPRPRLSDADVEHMTTVDGTDRMAFVADRDGELLGVARYDRFGDRSVAEVAFFTDDQNHGKGIATVLLEYLAAHAREVGITGFVAHVLPSNRRMVRVFKQAGFSASSEFADGVIEVTLDIEPTDAAATAIAERARKSERQAVARLLEPRSIAVIGASREARGLGHRVVRNLLAVPFRGPVYPVHPEAHAIAGLRAYPSVRDIPDEIDVAVICVPAEEVPSVVEDCGRAHVDAAIIISAGFGETGPAGLALEDEVLAAARRFGVRVLGPNCLGVINTADDIGLHATFAEIRPLAGPVGLLSQSGTLGAVILDQARRKGLGISSFVAVGNKADLSGNDLLQYWLDDDRTEVVLLYLESFGNPRRFGRNVREVAARKPVFAVRTGAVLDATESASGPVDASWLDDDTIDALLRETGVVRVPTINALLDAAVVASHQPVPAGGRVAVVGNSGGSASMAADACVDAGLSLAELSPSTIETIGTSRLRARRTANPVDLAYDADAAEYEPVLDAVAVDPGVDIVLVAHAPYERTDPDALVSVLDVVTTRHPEVTFVACVYGPHPPVTTAGVPIFDFPDEAAHAVGRVARYRTWLDAITAGDVLAVDDPVAVQATVRAFLGGARRRRLEPSEARDLLDRAGVATVPVVVGQDLADLTRQVAQGLPFGDEAVAVKAARHRPGASTRQSGVSLDVVGGAALLQTAEAMMADMGAEAWPMLVQPMVEPGTDIRVAIETHPVVGPVIRVGPAGGAGRFMPAPRRVLPLTEVEAAELIDDAGVSEALSPASRLHLVSTVRRLAAVVDAAPEIVELVCDPVIVRDDDADLVELQVTVEAVRPDVRPPVRRIEAV